MGVVNWTGKLVGCMIFEPLVEKLGFKKTIYILSCIQIVAVIREHSMNLRQEAFPNLTITVEISASSWIQFTTGRVVAYLAVGIVEPAIPTYQAELAPAALRGFFAGNVQVLVHLGSIWGAGMSRAYAYEQGSKGWRVPVGVQMIPAVLLLILTPFCVESPRWLISHNRKVSSCSEDVEPRDLRLTFKRMRRLPT